MITILLFSNITITVKAQNMETVIAMVEYLFILTEYRDQEK